MVEEGFKRIHADILWADAKGYSRLMEDNYDEDGCMSYRDYRIGYGIFKINTGKA